MENPYSIILPSLLCICLVVFLSISPTLLSAQTGLTKNSDSGKTALNSVLPNIISAADTSIKKIRSSVKTIPGKVTEKAKNRLENTVHSIKGIGSIKGDSLLKSKLSMDLWKQVFNTKPFVRFGGGALYYNFNYRSNIDTPYAEKDIVQHSVNANFKVSVAGIPFRINCLLRRSNSSLFKDINDIQAEYDVSQFRGSLSKKLKDQLLAMAPSLKDSLLDLTYKFNVDKLGNLKAKVNNPLTIQKLLEYKELLRVPSISFDSKLSDSANLVRKKALQNEAEVFIENYEARKVELTHLKNKVDSLASLYAKSLEKVQAYRSMVTQRADGLDPKRLKSELSAYGINKDIIPAKYRWLLGVKRFALGRSQLNYSELTSKNISLSGVNLEYNSWYYAAISGGTVDYRFRDFVINRNKRTPQYLFLGRLGVGRLEGNHFIVSYFKGKKQLFAVTGNNSGTSSIDITGFAAEGKLRLKSNGYFLAEVAESISPDFRKNPATVGKFDIKDKSNKAFSTRLYYLLPKLHSRLEGMYKYTGGNFQSFSSFQSNSELKSWYLKLDQQLFHKTLKIAAALKSNEFSNPYIIQRYKSNTTYKSVQLTYRKKRLPSLSLGYMPTSQITSIDSQLAENHFYSLNGSMTHTYKIGDRKATSTFVYNRFYNDQSDTNFLYYNAENIFFNQVIWFSLHTINFSVSHSKSPDFELNVLDCGVQFRLTKHGSIGFGAKVNNFDKEISATGGYGSLSLSVKKLGILSIQYENGFIPGSNHKFVRNEMFNMNFSRFFD